jgi:3-hydroxyisobutyrate dehydrogenase
MARAHGPVVILGLGTKSRALKDGHLALDVADDCRFAALAGLAHEWENAVEDGCGGQDLTVIARALKREGATR